MAFHCSEPQVPPCEMSRITFGGFNETALNLIPGEGRRTQRPGTACGTPMREHKPHERRARACLVLCCPPRA